MTIDEIKKEESRLAELYLTYYRMLLQMNEKYLEHEKIKVELTDLARKIEEDYKNLLVEKEKEDGEKLCECE